MQEPVKFFRSDALFRNHRDTPALITDIGIGVELVEQNKDLLPSSYLIQSDYIEIYC